MRITSPAHRAAYRRLSPSLRLRLLGNAFERLMDTRCNWHNELVDADADEQAIADASRAADAAYTLFFHFCALWGIDVDYGDS